MLGQWEARFHLNPQGTPILAAGVGYYECAREPGMLLTEAFLCGLQEYREEVWKDRVVFLVRDKTELREVGERNLCFFPTHQGVDVGITDKWRFFLSDPMMATDHCNALNVSYVFSTAGDSVMRDLVQTIIADRDLGLTLR